MIDSTSSVSGGGTNTGVFLGDGGGVLVLSGAGQTSTVVNNGTISSQTGGYAISTISSAFGFGEEG